MSTRFRLTTSAVALATAAVFAGAGPAQASTEWNFFVDAPGVQSTYIENAVIEDFEDGCADSWEMGIITAGTCASVDGDAYGGASTTGGEPTFGGVASQYGAFGPNHPANGTSLTLELDSPANYFGIWWTAGDRCNTLEFYSEGTLQSTFTFDRLMDLLDSGTLNGISGTDYSAGEYYGSPVNDLYNAEPFAYLHAFAPDATTFDEVRLLHDSDCGGFEFDNVAVASGVVTADVDTRLVSMQEDTTTPTENLAETGASNVESLLIAGLALGLAGAIIGRRRTLTKRSSL